MAAQRAECCGGAKGLPSAGLGVAREQLTPENPSLQTQAALTPPGAITQAPRASPLHTAPASPRAHCIGQPAGLRSRNAYAHGCGSKTDWGASCATSEATGSRGEGATGAHSTSRVLVRAQPGPAFESGGKVTESPLRSPRAHARQRAAPPRVPRVLQSPFLSTWTAGAAAAQPKTWGGKVPQGLTAYVQCGGTWMIIEEFSRDKS
jgi:hypothetical protein